MNLDGRDQGAGEDFTDNVFVMLCWDSANHLGPEGQYLCYYDPDAFDGGGSAEFTTEIINAKRFDSINKALDFWRKQSSVKPLRSDGRPNRPLTAFSVSIEQFDNKKLEQFFRPT